MNDNAQDRPHDRQPPKTPKPETGDPERPDRKPRPDAAEEAIERATAVVGEDESERHDG